MRTVLLSGSLLIFVCLICLVAFSCRGPEGTQGPAGPTDSVNESLVDPTIKPQVFATYPPAGSEGPFDDLRSYQIQIRFNKIMDPVSVRRALKVSSSFGGIWTDSTRIYNEGGDIFVIYVKDSAMNYYHQWSVGEVCTVKIDSTAKDINGNFLKPAYSMTFKPEPYFRVISITPAMGSTGVVTTDPTVVIYFNGKVDTSLNSFIHLTPAVPGKWYADLYDSTAAYYVHNDLGKLAHNTTYTITVGTNAHDRKGNYLQQEFVSTFTTMSFKLSYTTSSNGATNVSLSQYYMEVNFTFPVDTGSVRDAFSISPAIPGSLSLYQGYSSFYYYMSTPLTPNTNYVVTFSTHLRSMDGDTLMSPNTFTFTTVPFIVTNTSPIDSSTDVFRNHYIEFFFNSYIDTGAVRSSFSISPPVDGPFSYYSGATYFYFSANTQLAANTQYTVTLSDKMQSWDGSRMLAPYVLTFTTGN